MNHQNWQEKIEKLNRLVIIEENVTIVKYLPPKNAIDIELFY